MQKVLLKISSVSVRLGEKIFGHLSFICFWPSITVFTTDGVTYSSTLYFYLCLKTRVRGRGRGRKWNPHPPFPPDMHKQFIRPSIKHHKIEECEMPLKLNKAFSGWYSQFLYNLSCIINKSQTGKWLETVYKRSQ